MTSLNGAIGTAQKIGASGDNLHIYFDGASRGGGGGGGIAASSKQSNTANSLDKFIAGSSVDSSMCSMIDGQGSDSGAI